MNVTMPTLMVALDVIAIPAWAIGLGVTLLLALITYLIAGMKSWGSMTTRLDGFAADLTKLSTKSQETEKGITEIRRDMLKPEHLTAAILQVQLKVLQDSIADMGGNSIGSDRRRSRGRK